MLCHRSLCASWSPRIAGSELGEARNASVQRSMHLSGRAQVMGSQGGGSSEALKAKKANSPFMLALHPAIHDRSHLLIDRLGITL